MLDIDDATTLSEADWHELPSRAELPCTWKEYAASGGGTATKPDSTRKFCRVALPSIAIVWADDNWHAAYAKDVSKIGMGFYSPIQFLPRARVRVWLPGHSLLRVRIARCRRLKDNCFECGGLFEAADKTPRL
jgi:hypothetical protein